MHRLPPEPIDIILEYMCLILADEENNRIQNQMLRLQLLPKAPFLSPEQYLFDRKRMSYEDHCTLPCFIFLADGMNAAANHQRMAATVTARVRCEQYARSITETISST